MPKAPPHSSKDTGQGLVKGAILCFRNPCFYFQHGESTSTASQLASPASQKSKDLNKVLLLLQDLESDAISFFDQFAGCLNQGTVGTDSMSWLVNLGNCWPFF